MKRVMKRTQQFGGYHFEKGEQVFAKRIKGVGKNYILSLRKEQPIGPTVNVVMLNNLTELVEN